MAFPKRESLENIKLEDIESFIFTLIQRGEVHRLLPLDYIIQLPISGNNIGDIVTVKEDGYVRYWNGLGWVLISSFLSPPANPDYLGWFPTPVELNTGYPVGFDGNFAQVGNTDTIWVWDGDTNSWIDSGIAPLVTGVLTWSPAKSYIVNDGVLHNGKIWIGLAASLNKEPGVSVGFWEEYPKEKIYTTITDPAINTALTTAILDTYAGTIITTTGPVANQTFDTPISYIIGQDFTVVNNDTSTNPVTVIGVNTIIIEPGKYHKFKRDGTTFVSIDSGEIPVLWYSNGTDTKLITAQPVDLQNQNIKNVNEQNFSLTPTPTAHTAGKEYRDDTKGTFAFDHGAGKTLYIKTLITDLVIIGNITNSSSRSSFGVYGGDITGLVENNYYFDGVYDYKFDGTTLYRIRLNPKEQVLVRDSNDNFSVIYNHYGLDSTVSPVTIIFSDITSIGVWTFDINSYVNMNNITFKQENSLLNGNNINIQTVNGTIVDCIPVLDGPISFTINCTATPFYTHDGASAFELRLKNGAAISSGASVIVPIVVDNTGGGMGMIIEMNNGNLFDTSGNGLISLDNNITSVYLRNNSYIDDDVFIGIAGNLYINYNSDSSGFIINGVPNFTGIKVFTKLDINTIQVGNLTLLQASWSLVSGLYEYNLANVKITANSIVEVIPDNTDIDIVKVAEFLPRTDSSVGSVKIYATNQPTSDIGVTINITYI